MTANQPVTADDFMECDTCRAKPGTPYLCAGCLHNRALIGRLRLREKLREAEQRVWELRGHLAQYDVKLERWAEQHWPTAAKEFIRDTRETLAKEQGE